MRGVVRGLSQDGRRVAVLTDAGYTVLDLHTGEVSWEDVISGPLGTHGSVDLTNQTSGHSICGFVEAIQATTESARTLLGYR